MKNYIITSVLAFCLSFQHSKAKGFFIMKFNPKGEVITSLHSTIENNSGLSIQNSQGKVFITTSQQNGIFISGMKEIYTSSTPATLEFDEELKFVSISDKSSTISSQSIISDASRTTYILSHYTNSIKLNGHTFVSQGKNDMVLVKYRSDKQIDWAISEGSKENDCANSIDFDTEGNIIVTGHMGINPEIENI